LTVLKLPMVSLPTPCYASPYPGQLSLFPVPRVLLRESPLETKLFLSKRYIFSFCSLRPFFVFRAARFTFSRSNSVGFLPGTIPRAVAALFLFFSPRRGASSNLTPPDAEIVPKFFFRHGACSFHVTYSDEDPFNILYSCFFSGCPS